MSNYQNYIQFKKWSLFFSYSRQEEVFYKKIFNEITIQNKNFLDFGYGAGSLLAWAHENKAYIFGVEIQKDLLRIAKKKYGNLSLNFVNNIVKINNVKFDIVTIFNVLEHQDLKEIKISIKKVYACMSNNGILVITLPNCQSPAGLINQFGDPTHKSMLSGPIMQDILLSEGFYAVTYKSKPIQESTNFFKRTIKKLTIPIQMLFIIIFKITFSIGNAPLGPDIVIYATKK
jgi:2-polyprenyl-3-methyl-5-hydroxy-6-metoxy-1,4-benzoquinol methylase